LKVLLSVRRDFVHAVQTLAIERAQTMKILGICGSLQRLSANLALLHVAAASTPPNVEFALFDGLRDLPLFNPDLKTSGAPESVQRWRRALAESDAVFIATPEYGFSLPGALKNGIDWVIGSGELEGKIIAITGAAPAPERGRRGLRALRDTLSAVRAAIVGGQPIAKGPDFHAHVAQLVADLLYAVALADRVVSIKSTGSALESSGITVC
jgi:chromate reductase, NAD(P)H dehydrogenase (quinone)